MKNLILLIAFTVLAFNISSFAQVKTNFTQQDYSKFFKEDCIPKELKNENYILVVRTPFKESEEKKNNEIKEIFSTYYKGKFVIEPVAMKEFSAGNYTNAKVYRYCISMLEIYLDGDKKRLHKHYELSIIDALKLNKNNIDMGALSDSLTDKKGKKKQKVKDINLDDFDLTAIKNTGLEDSDNKLNEMLTFLAKKLGGYAE